MSDTATSVITSLISLIKASSALNALIAGRVYTYIPQTPAYPYVYLTLESEPINSLEFSDTIHTAQFQIFSEKLDPGEALNIRSALYTLLEENSTFGFCSCNGTLGLFTEPDGKTFRGLIEFRVKSAV